LNEGMTDSTETKKYGKVLAVVAVVGVLVLVPLVWLARRMSEEARQRRVVAANEAEALSILEGVAAAQQLFLQDHSRYGTFKELVEAGVFRAPLEGDALVAHGYNFRMSVAPRTDAAPPSFKVNADPLSREGANATGRRFFYLDSNLVGIRVNEDRPAGPSDPPRQTVTTY
jgi:hypothetical protein